MTNEAHGQFLLLHFNPVIVAMRDACTRVRAYQPALHVEDAAHNADTYFNAPPTDGYRRIDDLDCAISLLAYDDRDYENRTNDKGLLAKVKDFAKAASQADKEWFERRKLKIPNSPDTDRAKSQVGRDTHELSKLYTIVAAHMMAVLQGHPVVAR